jgi:hypothetical protein
MKKQRKKAEKGSDAESKVEIISFEAFFARAVCQGKVRFWQRDEVAAFFRDCRLREKEDSEKYEAALKRY